jgi:lipopolysaccharide transport system ATP-binding protein
MKRAEIDQKFDEIVAFSEIEKFLDTPVKRYSSGMYVRLAFSVAAHLEPEILLVDEVLAVGDASFQRKCLGKMGDVAEQGRTVLFVSHNMGAISALCSRACLLNNGKLIENGEVHSVVGRYLEAIESLDRVPLTERTDRGGNGRVRFTEVRILDGNGELVEAVASGQDVKISVGYRAMDGTVLENVKVGIGIYSMMGTFLLYCSNELVGADFRILPPEGLVSCTIPQLPLTPGQYSLNLSCLTNGILADWVIEAAILQVVEGDFFGTGRLPPATHGGFLTSQRWDASS